MLVNVNVSRGMILVEDEYIQCGEVMVIKELEDLKYLESEQRWRRECKEGGVDGGESGVTRDERAARVNKQCC